MKTHVLDTEYLVRPWLKFIENHLKGSIGQFLRSLFQNRVPIALKSLFLGLGQWDKERLSWGIENFRRYSKIWSWQKWGKLISNFRQIVQWYFIRKTQKKSIWFLTWRHFSNFQGVKFWRIPGSNSDQTVNICFYIVTSKWSQCKVFRTSFLFDHDSKFSQNSRLFPQVNSKDANIKIKPTSPSNYVFVRFTKNWI